MYVPLGSHWAATVLPMHSTLTRGDASSRCLSQKPRERQCPTHAISNIVHVHCCDNMPRVIAEDVACCDVLHPQAPGWGVVHSASTSRAMLCFRLFTNLAQQCAPHVLSNVVHVQYCNDMPTVTAEDEARCNVLHLPAPSCGVDSGTYICMPIDIFQWWVAGRRTGHACHAT
jgi:hypothetical protein